MSPRLPIIHSREEAVGDAFRRETLDLEFANGERRRYERLHSRGHGAVMIAAIPEPGTVLLIREYAAGVHRYELRSEEHTSELQSLRHLVCRLLLEKKNKHQRFDGR